MSTNGKFGSGCPVDQGTKGDSPVEEPSLAQILRSARAKTGLTQASLALRLGVSQSTVSFWESGGEVPTVEHVLALAIEFPEVVQSLTARDRQLLHRSLQLERVLFPGRCACPGCSCEQSRK